MHTDNMVISNVQNRYRLCTEVLCESIRNVLRCSWFQCVR